MNIQSQQRALETVKWFGTERHTLQEIAAQVGGSLDQARDAIQHIRDIYRDRTENLTCKREDDGRYVYFMMSTEVEDLSRHGRDKKYRLRRLRTDRNVRHSLLLTAKKGTVEYKRLKLEVARIDVAIAELELVRV